MSVIVMLPTLLISDEVSASYDPYKPRKHHMNIRTAISYIYNTQCGQRSSSQM